MMKKIIKPIILALVFLVALMGLSLFTGIDQTDLTEEMSEATLPVICLQKEDIVINELFGYKGQMNVTSIRDTITPLSEDMVLPITILTYQNLVEEIVYEVRTMDMDRLLEKTGVLEYSQKNGEISTQLPIQNLLEEDEEYRLIITLKCGGEEIRYYTRIILAKDSYIDESLEFVLNFHAKTFDPNAVSQLAQNLEPSNEGDNTTLQKVTIHSSLKQVGWADFEGEVLKDPIPSVKEISNSYNSIILKYIIVSSGENGETEFYNVEEYYRVRYSKENKRMYLLDYERTMNEIFRGSGGNVSGSSLLLGIRGQDVSYMTNEDASIIGFVQEGDLWSYNGNTGELSMVYSFRGMEGFNDRDNNQDHAVRIIRIDKDGNMDFVVYGYMNRGIHEGYTGVGLYRYDSKANIVQEKVFLQSQDSYQVLKESWGSLFYVNTKSQFYMIADGSLYRIHPEEKNIELVKEGLVEGEYAVSDDGRYVAWQEEETDNKILVTDLEKGTQWQITGVAGEILKPVGFVEADFVYGIIPPQETEGFFQKIVIVDKEQQVIKEYEKAGYYITDAYVEKDTVFLKRVWKTENGYMQVNDDTIKSQEIEAARKVKIETLTTKEKQTQVKLTTKKKLAEKTIQILTPKEVIAESEMVISLKTTARTGYYYVYVGGNLVLYTNHAGEAVQCADELAGVVLEDNVWYRWHRGKKSSASVKNEISPELTNRLTAKEAPESIIRDMMQEAQLLDLAGCSLSQVLYYISEGSLVFVQDENGEQLIITGYDERNVNLYHLASGEYSRRSLQEGEEAFKEAGNRFISYLKE